MLKKYLVLLAAVAASITVVLSVGTSIAGATICDGPGPGFTSYTAQSGFHHNGVPGVGESVWADLNYTIAVHNDGDFRQYVAVYGNGHYFQAGLINDGHGLQKYYEYDGVFLSKTAANTSQDYRYLFYKPGSGRWQLNNGQNFLVEKDFTATDVDYLSNATYYSSQPTCSNWQSHTNDIGPWFLSTNSPWDEFTGENPDSILQAWYPTNYWSVSPGS